MNFFERIEKMKPGFNALQVTFWRYGQGYFEKIEVSNIDPESSVILKDNVLEIKLVHAFDNQTRISFRIDKYEIFITSAGMGDSMFYQFPGLRDSAFYEAVGAYINAVLKGDFFKEVQSTEDGRSVQAVLKWKTSGLKEVEYSSLTYRIANLFLPRPIIRNQYFYSSFY